MDHEICDQAKAGKLIWSFIKLIAYAATAILISHCSTAHAQLAVVSGQAYNAYWGYYDGFRVQPASATVTIATSWVGMDVKESYQGGAQFDLGVFVNGQTFTDTSSMGANVPAGAPYTNTYYAYVSGTLESTYSITFSETGAVQNSQSGVYPWNGPNLVTGIWGCGGPSDTGTLILQYRFDNNSSTVHTYTVFEDGTQVDGGSVAAGLLDDFCTTDLISEPGAHTWAVNVDGVAWQAGTATVSTGQTVTVSVGDDTFAATASPSPSPSASPSPSPTASPTPSATPNPSGTPNPIATPNPTAAPTSTPDSGGGGASPTPDGGGGGASPTPDGGGGGATPAPSSSPSSCGTGTGDNTEQEMEAAIQATFGNTAGAPTANANDFQPQGNYTPAPDNTTAGLDSARSNLDGNLSTFTNMVPDLSGFGGIGTQYSFQVDCSGFGFGTVSLDFSPYQSGIQLIRALVLGMTGLILVIKFIKHMGPTL